MFARFCLEIPGLARRLRRSSMQSFRVYSGLAAPFPEVNVDTDCFEGRQGRNGRTHLMSPIMAAAAAITGRLTDVRAFLSGDSRPSAEAS